MSAGWGKFVNSLEEKKIHTSVFDLKNSKVAHASPGHKFDAKDLKFMKEISDKIEESSCVEFQKVKYYKLRSDKGKDENNKDTYVIGLFKNGDKCMVLAKLRKLMLICTACDKEIAFGESNNKVQILCNDLWKKSM